MQRQSRWTRGLVTALGILGGVVVAGRAAAQQPTPTVPTPEGTIRVSGVGEAQGRPDLARLSFAVETFATTAQEAGQENARVMEQVVQALVAAGVPRGDIETRNYQVHPEYVHDRPEAEGPRIRGYRASNQVSLRTTELDRVGALIDVALGAGANRVDGIAFEMRDAQPVQAEALRRAVERARASAETMAAALGVRLGRVLDASTGVDPTPPVPYFRMEAAGMARDMAVSTPIEPGEQTVRATATLIFAIER